MQLRIIPIILLLALTLIPITAGEETNIIQNVNYCSPNGNRMFMDLYLPISNVTTPIVLDIHGGGWQSGTKSNQWSNDLYPLLNANGIGLASIDYRFGKFPSQIQDVACAVRYLRANSIQYNINSSRIGVFGESAGGQLALLLASTNGTLWTNDGEYTQYQSNVNSVVTWFAPTDLNRHFDFSLPVNLLITQTFGILPYKITQDSPIHYPDSIPTLCIHGVNDSLVSIHQSIEFNCSLIPVINAGHSWTQIGNNPITPSIQQIELITTNWFVNHI